jgi:outer membrane biosynthesis protein TonB
MSKTIRTTVSIVVSLLLLSAMTMAQAAAKNSEKGQDKDKTQQHSRLSKVAFWRHHSDADKNAKKAQAAPASPKQANAKTAQLKPVAAKQVASTQVVAKKDQKPEQHSSKVTKPSTKKAPVANKIKQPQEKDSKAGLLKH